MLPVVEFALNNAVHVSTSYTSFYVNGLNHPRVSLTLSLCGSGLGGGDVADRLADISPDTVQKQVGVFLATRLNVLGHVRDIMAESQDQQKKNMQTLKTEVVLNVIRSETKYYLMLKTYLQVQCPLS